VLFALGLMIEAWEGSSWPLRAGEILLTVTVLGGAAYGLQLQQKKRASLVKEAAPGLAPAGFSRDGPHQPPVPKTPQQAAAAPSTVPEEIRNLAELRDSGILTEAEFQTKKGELLSRM
jgi:hypothetical protein